MADIEAMIRQMSNENTAKTFQFNATEAQKARNFEASMSNTSHQREVDDLKRAGLNPVLSANSGASSYSASSASGSADTSAPSLLAAIYQTKLNNDNAVKLAKMSNDNNIQIAKINAQASKYASDQASSASKYSSDMSYVNTRYSSDSSRSASRYASDSSRAASRYASDRGYSASLYSADTHYAGTTYGVDRSKYGMIYNGANYASRGLTGRGLKSNAQKAGSLVQRAFKAVKKAVTPNKIGASKRALRKG